MAALGGGRFVVAWNSFNSGPRVVEHVPATGWGTALPLAEGVASPIMANLGGASDGSAVVVSLANSRAGTGLELVLDRRDAATGNWVTAPLPLAARVAGVSNQRLPRAAPVAADAAWAGAAWLEVGAGSNPTLGVRAARLSTSP